MCNRDEKDTGSVDKITDSIDIDGSETLRRLYVYFAQRTFSHERDTIRLVELWFEHRHLLRDLEKNAPAD